MRRVVSEFAEEYQRLAMTTLAIGDMLEPSQIETRRLGDDYAGLSSATIRNMVLAQLVAIAEDFSRQTLLQCSLPHVELSHPLLRDIWRRAETQAEGAWEGHTRAWKDWHNVSFKNVPAYERLQAFIEARNAIMHGLGQLTKRQTQNDGGRRVIGMLGSVGIAVNGVHLSIDQPAVDNCGSTVKGFIEWLDLTVQEQGLDRAS